MNKILTLFLLASLSNCLHSQDFNLSFEKLDSAGLPINWFIQTNPKAPFIGKPAHQGAHSVQINTSYFYVPGNLYLGDVTTQKTLTLDDLGATGSFGFPIQHQVKSLKGWYKYERADIYQGKPDSGQVIVLLRHYLKAEEKTIIVGQGLLNLGRADQYTEFTVPIHYVQYLLPDTISIFFSSASGKYLLKPEGGIKLNGINSRHCASQFGGDCHYLTIDDLSLQFTIPTKNPRASLQPLKISPNPADGKTVITWELPAQSHNVELSISDALGRTLRSIQTDQNQLEVNTTDLPKGLYTVHLRQAGQLLGVERMLVAR